MEKRAPSQSDCPDGIVHGWVRYPLAFSLFPGNQNEQTSFETFRTKIVDDFGCDQFIFCSDAGLASETNREFNHRGKRAFIVTQSIKTPRRGTERALDKQHFRRLSDHKLVDITNLMEEDEGAVL